MSAVLEKGSPAEKRTLLTAGIVAILVLATDLLTKYWIVTAFELNESRELIPGLLAFTSVRNYGAAWSILSGHGWLLLLFALLVSVLLIGFFRTLCEGFAERYFAMMLLFAGIAGNSYDRVFRGAVVDFIHVHWQNIWHYPVFNVADIAICTAVGLFVISNFFRKSPEKSAGNGN